MSLFKFTDDIESILIRMNEMASALEHIQKYALRIEKIENMLRLQIRNIEDIKLELVKKEDGLFEEIINNYIQNKVSKCQGTVSSFSSSQSSEPSQADG